MANLIKTNHHPFIPTPPSKLYLKSALPFILVGLFCHLNLLLPQSSAHATYDRFPSMIKRQVSTLSDTIRVTVTSIRAIVLAFGQIRDNGIFGVWQWQVTWEQLRGFDTQTANADADTLSEPNHTKGDREQPVMFPLYESWNITVFEFLKGRKRIRILNYVLLNTKAQGGVVSLKDEYWMTLMTLFSACDFSEMWAGLEKDGLPTKGHWSNNHVQVRQ